MNETPLIQIDYLTVICGIQDHQQTCFRAQMIPSTTNSGFAQRVRIYGGKPSPGATLKASRFPRHLPLAR